MSKDEGYDYNDRSTWKGKALPGRRGNTFWLEPERLTLITDKEHHLYDERVELPLNEAMVKNVMVNGVKIPVEVTTEQADDDKIRIVVCDGRQRVKCAVEANKRLKEQGEEPIQVECKYQRGTETDLMDVMIVGNAFRQDDDPLTKASKMQRYMNRGKSKEEAAIQFGFSSAKSVENYLKLLDLCSKVQKALKKGHINQTQALKLHGMSKSEQEAELPSLMGVVTSDSDGEADKGEKATETADKPAKKKARQKHRGIKDGYVGKRAWSHIADQQKSSVPKHVRTFMRLIAGDIELDEAEKEIPGLKDALAAEAERQAEHEKEKKAKAAKKKKKGGK